MKIFLATAHNGAVEGGKGVYRATKEVGPPLAHDEPGPPVRSVGGPSLSFFLFSPLLLLTAILLVIGW